MKRVLSFIKSSETRIQVHSLKLTLLYLFMFTNSFDCSQWRRREENIGVGLSSRFV